MEEKPPSHISDNTIEQEPGSPQGSVIEKYSPKVPQRSDFRSVLLVMTCRLALLLWHFGYLYQVGVIIVSQTNRWPRHRNSRRSASVAGFCIFSEVVFFRRIVDLYGRKKPFIFGSFTCC